MDCDTNGLLSEPQPAVASPSMAEEVGHAGIAFALLCLCCLSGVGMVGC